MLGTACRQISGTLSFFSLAEDKVYILKHRHHNARPIQHSDLHRSPGAAAVGAPASLPALTGWPSLTGREACAASVAAVSCASLAAILRLDQRDKNGGSSRSVILFSYHLDHASPRETMADGCAFSPRVCNAPQRKRIASRAVAAEGARRPHALARPSCVPPRYN